MDKLIITALRVKTRIGVYAWEQKIDQTLLIDLEIPVDLNHFNHELKDTIDYDLLCRTITNHIESKGFELIETVGLEIITLIRSNFGIEDLITVRVSKPRAIPSAQNVTIVLTR